MTTTAWSHLPNAARIDAVLAHLSQFPQAWGGDAFYAIDSTTVGRMQQEWMLVSTVASQDVLASTRTAMYAALARAQRDAPKHYFYSIAWGSAWDAVWGAVQALAAYDGIGYLLDDGTPLDDVRKVLETDSRAMLLLPALIAMRGYDV